MEDELLDAVKAKNLTLVEGLIKKGANINYLFNTGYDAISWAVTEDDVEMVKLLLRYNVDLSKKYEKKNSSLLHYASDNYEIAKLLIDSGVEIDAQDSFGNTPLWAALHHQDYKVAELLLQHGADPNKKNRVGEILVGKKKQPLGETKTPFSASQDNGDVKALELFEKYKNVKDAK